MIMAYEKIRKFSLTNILCYQQPDYRPTIRLDRPTIGNVRWKAAVRIASLIYRTKSKKEK